MQSHNIVVSRYNENVDWIKEIPSNTCKVLLYNKGTDLPHQCIELPNVGREAHTYLTYIIQNYDNLANYNWFLQGNPFDHIEGLQWIVHNVGMDLPYDYVEFNVEQSGGLDHHWHGSLKDTQEANTILGIIGIGDVTTRLNYGAQFMASRKAIQSRPISFFEELLLITAQDNSSPWILERVWNSIFLNNHQYDKTEEGLKSLYRIIN